MTARELVIVGGGPVGLSAAIAAAQHGIDVALLEAQEEKRQHDPRVFALAHATQLLLEHLGVWKHIRTPHPILTVQVSERGAFGATTLSADLLGLGALGYVVAQTDLVQALRRRALELGLECIDGALVLETSEHSNNASVRYLYKDQELELAAPVVALAEGGATLADQDKIIERSYGQHAITATVTSARLKNNHAYERFTAQGPIALLPLDGMHALIWTVRSREAQPLLELTEAEFERALRERYGQRIGEVRLRGPRAAFVLKLRFARQSTGVHLVRIGNAAQTLHPVAGQGFNLGLRDAYELADSLALCAHRGQGLSAGVQRYRARRRLDRIGGTLFTDFLVRVFSTESALVACARSSALAALDMVEPAKRFLLRRMIFGAPR